MISDEPDEDADILEDEDVMEAYLVPDGPGQAPPRRPPAENFADWPPQASMNETPLGVDAETLGWFKAHHADWQAAMADVLQAWVHARMQATLTWEGVTGDEASAG